MISADRLPHEVRLMLREQTWASAWQDPGLRFYVHVGYDYHLHVGSHVDCSRAVRPARWLGLVPEPGFVSPSLDDPAV